MLYPKVLFALFSIAFLNVVVLAASEEIENCDFPCDVNDTKPVCVWDNDEICFRILPSKCVMERMQCIFQKDYMIYIDMYCDLEAFMCNDQSLVQSPPEDSNQVHNYNESSEENVEVIVKTVDETTEKFVNLNTSFESGDDNN